MENNNNNNNSFGSSGSSQGSQSRPTFVIDESADDPGSTGSTGSTGSKQRAKPEKRKTSTASTVAFLDSLAPNGDGNSTRSPSVNNVGLDFASAESAVSNTRADILATLTKVCGDNVEEPSAAQMIERLARFAEDAMANGLLTTPPGSAGAGRAVASDGSLSSSSRPESVATLSSSMPLAESATKTVADDFAKALFPEAVAYAESPTTLLRRHASGSLLVGVHGSPPQGAADAAPVSPPPPPPPPNVYSISAFSRNTSSLSRSGSSMLISKAPPAGAATPEITSTTQHVPPPAASSSSSSPSRKLHAVTAAAATQRSQQVVSALAESQLRASATLAKVQQFLKELNARMMSFRTGGGGSAASNAGSASATDTAKFDSFIFGTAGTTASSVAGGGGGGGGESEVAPFRRRSTHMPNIGEWAITLEPASDEFADAAGAGGAGAGGSSAGSGSASVTPPSEQQPDIAIQHSCGSAGSGASGGDFAKSTSGGSAGGAGRNATKLTLSRVGSQHKSITLSVPTTTMRNRRLSVNVSNPFAPVPQNGTTNDILGNLPPMPGATAAATAETTDSSHRLNAERLRRMSVMSDTDLPSQPQQTLVVEEGEDDVGMVCINEYVVLGDLGEGAQAPVVHAVHAETGEEFAIKIVPRPTINPTASSSLQRQKKAQLELMKREIKAMSAVRHRNCVKLHEVIDDENARSLFLVMEFIQKGVAASSLIDGSFDRRYTAARIAHFGRRLCAALQYLHERNIVHRDIKPENILLRADLSPAVCDFGVCTILDAATDGQGRLPTVKRKPPMSSFRAFAGVEKSMSSPSFVGTPPTANAALQPPTFASTKSSGGGGGGSLATLSGIKTASSGSGGGGGGAASIDAAATVSGEPTPVKETSSNMPSDPMRNTLPLGSSSPAVAAEPSGMEGAGGTTTHVFSAEHRTSVTLSTNNIAAAAAAAAKLPTPAASGSRGGGDGSGLLTTATPTTSNNALTVANINGGGGSGGGGFHQAPCHSGAFGPCVSAMSVLSGVHVPETGAGGADLDGQSSSQQPPQQSVPKVGSAGSIQNAERATSTLGSPLSASQRSRASGESRVSMQSGGGGSGAKPPMARSTPPGSTPPGSTQQMLRGAGSGGGLVISGSASFGTGGGGGGGGGVFREHSNSLGDGSLSGGVGRTTSYSVSGHGSLRAAPSMMRGTGAFAAPEQHAPGFDPRHANAFASDCFALGLTLYCLLYGCLPWSVIPAGEYVAHIESDPIPFPPTWSTPRAPLAECDEGRADPDPPEELLAILKKMLHRDPFERIGVDEAREALKALDCGRGEAGLGFLDQSGVFGALSAPASPDSVSLPVGAPAF